MAQQQPWDTEFYEDSRGRRPCVDWLGSLPGRDRSRIDHSIALLEAAGPLLPSKYCDRVRGKLYELKTSVARMEYRIFYFSVTGRKFILLHGFIKKSQKTPRQEIEAAVSEMNDYVARQGRRKHGE